MEVIHGKTPALHLDESLGGPLLTAYLHGDQIVAVRDWKIYVERHLPGRIVGEHCREICRTGPYDREQSENGDNQFAHIVVFWMLWERIYGKVLNFTQISERQKISCRRFGKDASYFLTINKL